MMEFYALHVLPRIRGRTPQKALADAMKSIAFIFFVDGFRSSSHLISIMRGAEFRGWCHCVSVCRDHSDVRITTVPAAIGTFENQRAAVSALVDHLTNGECDYISENTWSKFTRGLGFEEVPEYNHTVEYSEIRRLAMMEYYDCVIHPRLFGLAMKQAAQATGTYFEDLLYIYSEDDEFALSFNCIRLNADRDVTDVFQCA
jgi:hypothetical protein